MSKRERRDGDRGRDDRGRDDRGRDDRGRDDRGRDRRDSQPDDEQQRRLGEDAQESDSLTALKAVLAKVSSLLNPLQLTQDESIRLVEQLYGSVLAMDVLLAGEPDDRRKSLILGHLQNTSITRVDGKIVVEYPKERPPEETPAAPQAQTTAGTETTGDSAPEAVETKATHPPAGQPTTTDPAAETGTPAGNPEPAPAAPKPRAPRQSAPRRPPREPAQPVEAPAEPAEPTPPETGPSGD